MEVHIPSFLSFTRLQEVWERLRTSFWFLPSSMAGGAIALSFAFLQLDTWLTIKEVREFGLFYTFGPEGARAVLAAIASSMITVAGLTFSITMLTLQLASSQFGPRLLRNFLRDRGNQIVLGTFISTFVYCLLVLRTVRGAEGASLVPHVSVAFGVLLALASLAILIYFIHHVATSIRIETLLAELANETHEAIDNIYPEPIGHGPQDWAQKTNVELLDAPDFGEGAQPVLARRSGYVQRIDGEALMRLASARDLVVRIDAAPGQFVATGDVVLSAHPRSRVPDEAIEELQNVFIFGPDRTPEQDLSFSLRRLVEISQRALSPGINDPTTALYCIDRLGEALGHLAGRDMSSSMRFDERGQLRVIAEVRTFQQLACPAFAAIARYGLNDADVVRHLLDVMDIVSQKAGPGARRAIADLGAAIRDQSMDRARFSFDRDTIGGNLAGSEPPIS